MSKSTQERLWIAGCFMVMVVPALKLPHHDSLRFFILKQLRSFFLFISTAHFQHKNSFIAASSAARPTTVARASPITGSLPIVSAQGKLHHEKPLRHSRLPPGPCGGPGLSKRVRCGASTSFIRTVACTCRDMLFRTS